MSRKPTQYGPEPVAVRTVPIAEIEVHANTQSRRIHAEIVAEYAKLMREGVQFPPVDVFDDGQKLYAADGFHRLEAAKKEGQTEIKAKVHKGTRLDAFKFSLRANHRHGLRPTLSDKRYAVDRALNEFPDHSDRQLAEMCGVSPTFVGKRRRRQPTVHGDSSAGAQVRIGKDGKRRRMPKSTTVESKTEQENTSAMNGGFSQTTKSTKYEVIFVDRAFYEKKYQWFEIEYWLRDYGAADSVLLAYSDLETLRTFAFGDYCYRCVILVERKSPSPLESFNLLVTHDGLVLYSRGKSIPPSRPLKSILRPIEPIELIEQLYPGRRKLFLKDGTVPAGWDPPPEDGRLIQD